MKKFIAVLLAVAAAVMILVGGCGRQPAGQSSGSGNSVLDRVIAAKKLRVGILPDYAPWSSRNAQGQFEGYDVDLAFALGKALGVDVELVPVEAPARVPSLVSDKVDLLIACLSPTDERAKTISFTIPYAAAGQVPMVWADNNTIKSYKDLAGKKVAVVRGGTARTRYVQSCAQCSAGQV